MFGTVVCVSPAAALTKDHGLVASRQKSPPSQFCSPAPEIKLGAGPQAPGGTKGGPSLLPQLLGALGSPGCWTHPSSLCLPVAPVCVSKCHPTQCGLILTPLNLQRPHIQLRWGPWPADGGPRMCAEPWAGAERRGGCTLASRVGVRGPCSDLTEPRGLVSTPQWWRESCRILGLPQRANRTGLSAAGHLPRTWALMAVCLGPGLLFSPHKIMNKK